LFKKFNFFAVIGLLVLILAACGEADIKKVDGDNGSANSDGEKKDTPAEQQLKVGETVNFDGLKITLNEARVEPGGDFDEPQNDKFVVVNLTAENTTDEEQVISSLMNVELRDSDGYSYNTTILVEGTKGQFDGTIEAGGKLRGEIPFDVSESDTYELHFSDLFKSGKAIWVIPSSDLK